MVDSSGDASVPNATTAGYAPNAGQVQNNSINYATDSGTANTYVATYIPAITTLTDGMILSFQALHANTGASTFNCNGTAYPILGAAHSALQSGEIVVSGKVEVMWHSSLSSWILLECTGGSVQVPNATQSLHAINLGQANSLYGGGITVGASITAAGTNQATATALTNTVNIVTSVATGTGVVFSGTPTGVYRIVVNKGVNPLAVYPASGGYIDGNAINVPVTIPVGGFVQFYGSTSTQWYTSIQSITTAAGMQGTVGIASGGTGLTATPTNGQILIGNGSGFALSTITPGGNISITNTAGGITISSTGAAFTTQEFIPTASQTTFTISGGYTPGAIEVFLNGIKLNVSNGDYTATNGTTIVLSFGAQTTDVLSVNIWNITSIGSAGISTNLANGTTNAIPYQSSPGNTTFLATGTGVLSASGGAPSWNSAPTLTGTNISGTAASLSIGGNAATVTTLTYTQIFSAINSQSNTDWYRTSGSTGWYNSTYSVGLYSAGAGLVQTYNSSSLQVNGTLYATGNVIAYYSDMRLKADEGTIQNALDIVCEWRGFYYRDNEIAKKLGLDSKRRQVGLATQDLQKRAEELVFDAPFDIGREEDGTEYSISGENYKTAQYERAVPFLVEAIKELRNEIKNLKNEIILLKDSK